MPLPVRRKFPTEGKTYSFEFAEKMPPGDSPNGAIPPTMEIESGLTAGSAVLNVSTMEVLVRLSGGILGQSYYCAASIKTTLGDTLKVAFMLEISNNAN